MAKINKMIIGLIVLIAGIVTMIVLPMWGKWLADYPATVRQVAKEDEGLARPAVAENETIRNSGSHERIPRSPDFLNTEHRTLNTDTVHRTGMPS